jgi:hypothetical protein
MHRSPELIWRWLNNGVIGEFRLGEFCAWLWVCWLVAVRHCCAPARLAVFDSKGKLIAKSLRAFRHQPW